MLSCTVLELTMLPTCLSTSSLPGSPCDCRDTVSEWFRRWTRNPLGSARRGSNPLGVAFAHSTQDIFALIRHVPERKHIAARSLLAHGIAVARSPPSHVSLLLVRHRSKSHGTHLAVYPLAQPLWRSALRVPHAWCFQFLPHRSHPYPQGCASRRI